jgi:hypothetical protein
MIGYLSTSKQEKKNPNKQNNNNKYLSLFTVYIQEIY